jgi:hypothetical protein
MRLLRTNAECGKLVVCRCAEAAGLFSCAMFCLIAVTLLSAQGLRPFSAEQALAGRAAYQRYCLTCHGEDLTAINDAPLVGQSFMMHWGARSTTDLFHYIEKTMPPTSPGDAGFQVDLSIVAFILKANGAKAGTRPLTTASTIVIGSVVNGVPVKESETK